MIESDYNQIERLEDKYGIEGLSDDIVAHWRGDEVQQLSVRQLAEMVNTKVLDAALRDSGIIHDEHVISALANNLKDGEAPLATTEFEERGVDIADVREDFIDYRMVHRYLTEERKVSYNRVNTPSTSIGTLETLEDRVKSIYQQTIRQLHNTGQFADPEPVVDVDVGLQCRTCGTRTSAMIYLQSGGCPSPDCTTTDH